MKAKILLILFILPVLFTFGQRPQRCSVALPDPVFKQKRQSVVVQPTDEKKLDAALSVASNNCLSVEQVKAIADLFLDDYNRLEFAEAAWHNTVDRENFYYVYDAFAYFSTVFMLHDYVKSVEGQPTDYLPPYDPPLSLNFPAFDYPSYENYRGRSNCNYPIREDDFLRLARQVMANKSEVNRGTMLDEITRNNCLSVAQAMKFSSFLQSEENRLSFFHQAIPAIFDLGNLQYGAQMFAHIPNKGKYNNMINQPMPPQPPNGQPCMISNQEFAQILISIKKESFNNTKLVLARQILRSKQCFTTQQVIQIAKLFSFDDARLEIAKFAWDYTIDRDNYYQVADVFSYKSHKDELMKFLDRK